jgi:hypothetical protein
MTRNFWIWLATWAALMFAIGFIGRTVLFGATQ